MSKQIVRVKESYPDWEFVGVEAVIIKYERLSNGGVLLGFPLDSPFGWYDEYMSTGYNLWYISEKYLEPVQVFLKSKFR